MSIRDWVAEHVRADVASAVRIQYRGSMKGANAKELLVHTDIDGMVDLLVERHLRLTSSMLSTMLFEKTDCTKNEYEYDND